MLFLLSEHGFLAASSGDFGQALAKACQQLGKACVVVMPTTSAKVKIAAVQGFGATIKTVDTALKSRAARVASWQSSTQTLASPVLMIVPM